MFAVSLALVRLVTIGTRCNNQHNFDNFQTAQCSCAKQGIHSKSHSSQTHLTEYIISKSLMHNS